MCWNLEQPSKNPRWLALVALQSNDVTELISHSVAKKHARSDSSCRAGMTGQGRADQKSKTRRRSAQRRPTPRGHHRREHANTSHDVHTTDQQAAGKDVS